MLEDKRLAHATVEVFADAPCELLRAGHDALRLHAYLRRVPVGMQTAHELLHGRYLHGTVGHLVRLPERDPGRDGCGQKLLVG